MTESNNDRRETDEVIYDVLKHLLATKHHLDEINTKKTNESPVDAADHEQYERNNV